MSQLLQRLRAALGDEYRVERELASGGMGQVFLARDLNLDRDVAVKVMRPERATALAAERFLQEARILASFRHPNIVPIHRVGEADGLFFYVMERVEGETLEERLRRGPLSSADALKLGRDLLDALEAAHRAGIIHRDIKPANILRASDRALLGDFGIARVESAQDGQTTEGWVVGTPGYMSPEQAAGGAVSPHTDLYATGAVLYESFTGRRWPMSDNVDWSAVPRAVIPVLRRALAWTPQERWPDAQSFRRSLWRTRSRRYQQRALWLTLGGLSLGVGMGLWLQCPAP